MEDEEIKSEEMLEQTNETENTDTQTVEENVETVEEKKTFKQMLEENPEYQEELNNMMKSRVSRAENAVRREYEEKYSPLDNTLKAALGTTTVEESTTKLKEFYQEQGVNIPDIQPKLNDHDLQILAEAEAKEIINSGYDDIKTELDRLVEKGTDKMTNREKLICKHLAEAEKVEREKKDLRAIGIKEFSDDFKAFADKLDGSKMTMKEKYELYEKLNPKEEKETIGSMKGTTTKQKYKDFYTAEEARRFTEKDLDDPILMDILQKSMTRWEQEK